MTAAAAAVVVNRTRRRSELTLGVLVVILTGGGYVLVALSDDTELPADLWVFLASVFGLYVVAHLAVRRFASGADATLLPLAAALNGIGFVTISRLDRELARIQAGWVAIAVAAFVVTLILVRDTRFLEKYRYTFALLGVLFLLLPLLPGIGRTLNGARLWVSIGPLNFQPGEIAKVLLVIFFAAYLADNRDLLAAGSVRIGRFFVPALRHLGPLALAWGFSILVMVYEKDLGSSLLFFGVFAAMLYMATSRAYYLVVGLVFFAIGALIAYQMFGHVQVRVDTWLDPWQDAADTGYQILQSWFAFGTGGFAGTGLGLGNPDKIPNAATDFVFSAIGEELGLIGTISVVIGFMLLVGSAYRVAVDAVRPFSKLFAAGLATIIGLQTVIILGGVTRLIPLTGITLPFVSYGGSSLVANFVLLALLLRVSDESARAPGSVVNATIRRVGIGMLVLFTGLIAQLTYLQVVRANDLKNDPGNVRVFLRDYARPRGLILTADGVILAESEKTDDDLEQIRVYPPETAALFAHVVGYQAVNLGSTGAEAEFNDELVGRDFDVAIDDISDFFSGQDKRGNVVLSLTLQAQRLAADGLAGQRGSVVVLDVPTGAIVAAYSNPTFDPNPLASHDTDAASTYFDALNADPTRPALARSWREIFAPGSTFKVVTSGIGLESELTPHDPAPPGPPYRLSVDNPVYPDLRELDLPQSTSVLHNFGDSQCGGSLAESFRVSCNTTFAQIGLDLGDTFAAGIERFGVSTGAPDTDLRPGMVRSIGPEVGDFQQNQAGFAQAAIGQGAGNATVAVTPMAMAMVAQSVANGGTMMTPHVLGHVENNDGEVVRGTAYEPNAYQQAMQPQTAATVRDLMVDVVNNGTGRRAQIPGIQVAGKTGTAQVQDEPAHAWFIGFAPAEAPRYAIAVLVENGGNASGGDDATGGRVAAPIAKQVLTGLLQP